MKFCNISLPNDESDEYVFVEDKDERSLIPLMKLHKVISGGFYNSAMWETYSVLAKKERFCLSIERDTISLGGFVAGTRQFFRFAYRSNINSRNLEERLSQSPNYVEVNE